MWQKYCGIICDLRTISLKNATKSHICVLGGVMVAFDNRCYGSPVWLIVTFIKNWSLMFNHLRVLGGLLSTTGIWNFSLPRWGNYLSTFKTITPWLLVPAKVLSVSDSDSSFALFFILWNYACATLCGTSIALFCA